MNSGALGEIQEAAKLGARRRRRAQNLDGSRVQHPKGIDLVSFAASFTFDAPRIRALL